MYLVRYRKLWRRMPWRHAKAKGISKLVLALTLFSLAVLYRETRTRSRGTTGQHKLIDCWSPSLGPYCDVPLCIIAHGAAARDTVDVLRLERYLARHPTVPAMLVLQLSGGHVATAQVYNMGPDTRRILGIFSKRMSRVRGDMNAGLNAMHEIAVTHLRACSVWEISTSMTLACEDCVTTQIARSLRPRDSVGSIGAHFHLGVRPRGTSGPETTGFLPVVNAHTLFSPTTYYAPRGFPENLLHDDERGRGLNAPEFIRIVLNASSESDSAIAVVQSTIDGVPDAAVRYAPAPGEPIKHRSFVSAVVLPQGVFHPYNRLATLHRYEALWALFTPVRSHVSFSDVVRGYVAQAIFPILGCHLAIVKPLVSRQNDARDDKGGESTPIGPVIAHLARWSLAAQDKCKQHAGIGDCVDAGSLLVAAYRALATSALCKKQDVADARLWISRLRSSGYKFPIPVRRHAATRSQISPRRPPTLNVHAAVHLNWGKYWRGVVPLWHAMHAAEFKQVTYHVQRRPDATNPAQSAGIYPRIAYYLDDPPGITSGYLAFQSAIQAWSVHDRSTEALHWSHEDAFTDHNFLAGWLKQTSSCVVVSDVTDYLPSNVTEWASATDWPWAKETRTQVAGMHFLDLIADRGKTLKCVGRDFAKSGFAYAQSDVVAIRTTCNGTEPRLLFDLLQAASDAGLWLEISWPNCIRCAFEKRSIFGYRLFTRWDEQRNNASATWAQYTKRTHDVYHPLKLTGALMTRLSMRDDGWTQWWAENARK